MTKIKAERMSGSVKMEGTFSRQSWDSGHPQKQGWREVTAHPKAEPIPEVLESKGALKEIPAAEMPDTLPQIDELRAAAKALKVRGAHLMGAEKLVEEIAKAKKANEGKAQG